MSGTATACELVVVVITWGAGTTVVAKAPVEKSGAASEWMTDPAEIPAGNICEGGIHVRAHCSVGSGLDEKDINVDNMDRIAVEDVIEEEAIDQREESSFNPAGCLGQFLLYLVAGFVLHQCSQGTLFR